VSDDVGARLLDADHDVVDRGLVGAVLVKVVTDAVAGAQEPRRLGGQAEAQPGDG